MGILGIYARTSAEKAESTSIEQQIKMGVDFCIKNNLSYKVFQDKKLSGYKIVDDDNPFQNRPALLELISEIERKTINKIWVAEFSRLSRNDTANFVLNKIFKKYNVTIYVKDTEYNLNNPQNKLIQGILSQIAEYERFLIVERITRGIHNNINSGFRAYNKFFGYKKSGKNGKFVNWIPVDSEIEKLKYLFEKYNQGISLTNIINDLYKDSPYNNKRELIRLYSDLLKHFSYTGNILNTKGIELLNKYREGEIDKLCLNNPEFYIKSKQFPLEIVSIEDWINIQEKLKIKSVIYNKNRYRAGANIGTGIIKCHNCNLPYHFVEDRGYKYYKHINKDCQFQKPKSLNFKNTDNLFTLFFFYFYLVFDDTKELIKENQKLLKLNLVDIKNKIKIIENANKDIKEQIENFKSVYKQTKDIDKLNLIIEKEIELKSEKTKNDNEILKFKNEIINLKTKFENDKAEIAYSDIRKLIIDFFENMDNENKRSALLKIIKKCVLFNKNLLIESGVVLFIFNIDYDNTLLESVYKDFKNNKYFMDNFLNSNSVINDNGELKIINDWLEYNNGIIKDFSLDENIKDIKNLSNYFKVRKFGNYFIEEFYLTIPENKIIISNKFEKMGIDYNLEKINKVVFF